MNMSTHDVKGETHYQCREVVAEREFLSKKQILNNEARIRDAKTAD